MIVQYSDNILEGVDSLLFTRCNVVYGWLIHMAVKV